MADQDPPRRPDVAGIHLSMAVDRGFEMPLAVALTSLAETQVDLRCTVAVMASGVSRTDRDRLVDDVAGRLDLEWLDVPEERLTGARFTEGLSAAALFRILLPELLPTRSRTIYLDADTLVRSSLAELWAVDLDGCLVGAVRDAGSPFAAGPAGTDWRGLGLAPDTDYFNSGMMVMDLDRFRSGDVTDAAIGVLRGTAGRWGDQDALNVVAKGSWKELSRRWNFQTADAEGRSLSWALWREDVEASLAQPAVLHYTEDLKPWRGRPDHPFAAQWFDQLARTSWAGECGPPSAGRRLMNRLGRAAEVLRRG